ncbi:MAG: SprB repeat-containing protein, partial [Saprospiraceae bacterium]|nr:SprB repeat-containing protein [Saprospiraceae bacterium]
MNAFYTLLSDAFQTKKHAIFGWMAIGVFSTSTLGAQVVEPSGNEAPVQSDVVAQSVVQSLPNYSGSPTTARPASPGSSVIIEDQWSGFIDWKKNPGVPETDCDCPDNVILNPSFENGTTSWNWWNGSFVTGTYAAQCGTKSGQFQHSGNGGWGGAYQDVTNLPVGAPIRLKVYSGVHNTGNQAFVALEFYDVNWDWISDIRTEVNAQLPAMSQYTLNTTIPANTKYVRMVGYCDWDWIKMDMVCLEVICDNVTSGGTIGSDQVACGVSSFDPALLTNIASPSGGSGNLEYMWLKANGPNCPAVGDPAWQQISGANSATYDPPVITASTCYMRCSRRAGCDNWDGESNILKVSFDPAINLTTTKVDVKCNGALTGSIDLTVSGGTSPYTYAWSNSKTTQDISGLAAGTYTVTVTDAAGCTKTTSVTINQPSALSLSTTKVNVKCNGGNTGSIDLTVTGGTPGYTYIWTNAATTQDISNLTAGTYTVTVTDANACTKTISTTITQPSALSLTSTQKNLLCYGATDGDIDLSVSGGTSPYTYSWSNGATVQDLWNIGAGTYTVTVTDANACTKTLSATITQPAEIILTKTITDVKCAGQSNGAIDLTVSGGSPGFKYSWSNSATTQDISNLAAGTYTVTVTDVNGCTKTTSATVNQPGVLTPTTTKVNVACFGGNTGSIDLSVTGGTSPYTYAWSNAATTQDISNLVAGTYTVTVTDANLCTKTVSTSITQPASALNVTETHVDVNCNGQNTGSIDATPTGGTTPYTYSWSNGATTQDISGLTAGTYTLTVT